MPSILNSWVLAKPKQPKQSTKPQLNHHLPLNPRSLGAADKSRVVVGHVEREAGARGVKTVLALDGQRQLGLVAGQAQRQEQLDPAAVELRHGERVVGGGAAGGFAEKAEAAARCGVQLIVLRRPDDEGETADTILQRCRELL